jgi:hypothetical protein
MIIRSTTPDPGSIERRVEDLLLEDLRIESDILNSDLLLDTTMRTKYISPFLSFFFL